jgi:hypothetical protein
VGGTEYLTVLEVCYERISVEPFREPPGIRGLGKETPSPTLRVGRFLMNTMMASGGYPWTVIPVSDRNAYVNALEKASVGEDIAPFADFLAGLVKRRLAGEPLPAVPKASLVDER